jgi:hypothetical protein
MKPTLILTLAAFAGGTLTGAIAIKILQYAGPLPPADAVVAQEGSASAAIPAVAVAEVRAGPVSDGTTVSPAPGGGPTSEPPDSQPTTTDEPENALEAWRELGARVSQLSVRLASVEQAIARVEAEQSPEEAEPERPARPRTADERREALVSAGVDAGLADDIVWREGQVELERLALRDLATREGWLGTKRYRDELNQIGAEGRPIREEIGDASYDRFLHATGEDNRVQVSSVIPGSAAEAAGFQDGDLVESYAGERVFRFSELREATTQGESGELVAVRLRRGGRVIDAWVPRGPLGVRLDMARAEPYP